METQNQITLDQYLSVNTVAVQLEVSRGTVYNLINRGLFEVTEITPDIKRLKASQIKAYLDSRTQKK